MYTVRGRRYLVVRQEVARDDIVAHTPFHKHFGAERVMVQRSRRNTMVDTFGQVGVDLTLSEAFYGYLGAFCPSGEEV